MGDNIDQAMGTESEVLPFDVGALPVLATLLKRHGYKFTTITPASHKLINSRAGNAWAKNIRDVFGWSRPFREGLLPVEIARVMMASRMAVPYGDGWKSRLRLSSLGEDLFWHSAFPTSEADSVFFGPDTYRFASAIGSFLDQITIPVKRAIELCCGVAPAAVTIAKACPQASVSAGDINSNALDLTRANASIAGIQLDVRPSDLLEGFEGDFDLITANPPYLVDSSERTYRHGGGPLGLEISKKIVVSALGRLSPGGSLLLYTGVAIVGGEDPLKNFISARLRSERTIAWTYQEVDPDVFGEELSTPPYNICDRIAAVVVVIRKAEPDPI